MRSRLVKTEELALRWYRSSNNITINGLKAEEIGKQLELYATNETNITESLDENHLYSNEIGIHPTTNNQACKTPYLINNERLYSLEDTVEILKAQLILVKSELQDQRSGVLKVINEAHVECLRQENSQLREENVALNERLNNLGSVLSDLNTKLKTSEEEKASLLTAIRLLQTDIETGCKMALNHQSQITLKEANAISKGNNTKTALERNPVAPGPNLDHILGVKSLCSVVY